MCPITVSKNPRMTRYLVEVERVFSKYPLTIIDVGGRGGVNSEWSVFGNQARMFCFEPDEAECNRLNAEGPGHVTYIPTALGVKTGPATIYEAQLKYSSGLYETRMDYFKRFVNWRNGEIVGEHVIQVKSLEDAIRDHGIPPLDFIKLDAEGAELDILKGGASAFANGRGLGVLSEFRLHREINGSPPFYQLDGYLQEHGFRLYDMSVNHHGRVALPYPQQEDYRLPSGERFFAYTRHGQLQDGDALYFRDLVGQKNLDPLQVLKLASLMEIYSLGDCAAELILDNRQNVDSLVDTGRLLDLLVRGMTGTETNYEEYVRAYWK